MSVSTDQPRILVMGVGNPLMGDEGVGPRAVELLLTHYRFPDNVEVTDAGTMGFSILNLFQGVDHVIVVDAVDGTGQEPGTVLKLDPDSMSPNQILHSLHDTRLTDVLDAARLMGLEPDVACIGVQVAQIVHWKVELSPVVEAALEPAVSAVVDLLAERGVTVEAAEPGVADVARVIAALRTKGDMTG